MPEKHMPWTPPRRPTQPGSAHQQMTLPGVGFDLPPGRITPNHPLYGQRDNPHVWGTLAEKGLHNPFHDYGIDPSDDYDIHSRWSDSWIEGHQYDQVRKHLQRIVNRAAPCIQVSHEALHNVLDDGRFKNQHETSWSRGAYNPDRRKNVEYHHFGYPGGSKYLDDLDQAYEGYSDLQPHEKREWVEAAKRDQPGHARPLYGYLAHSPFHNTTSRMYGEHTVVLHKPSIWHRTTVTFGDSLDEQHDLKASHVYDVHPESFPLGDYRGGKHWHGAGDDEEHQQIRVNFARMHHLDRSLEYPGYTEAQYHGGLSASHIHYVILRNNDYGDSPAPLQHLKNRLTEKAIPWVQHERHLGVKDEFRPHASRTVLSSYQAILEGAMSSPATVVAHDGPRYVLDLGNGQGQIADTSAGLLYPPQALDSILAHLPYAQPVRGLDAEDILSLVRPAAV